MNLAISLKVVLMAWLGSSLAEDRERLLFFGRSPSQHQLRQLLPRVDADYNEEMQVVPEYTEALSDVYTRDLDQANAQKHYPICRIKRRVRGLNTAEFEYRPAYYEETQCVPEVATFGPINEICSSLGFSCVQWNKTLHLTRRRYSSECWETRTLVIPAGCECMWPAHRLGDIPPHSRI